MTLKLLVVSIFRWRILQRFFLRVPRLSALHPKIRIQKLIPDFRLPIEISSGR
jgi:hypothetical protein